MLTVVWSQVPCVAVESAVYGVVCGASVVFVVGFPELAVFPGGPGVDSVVGVECVSGCRYVGQVGFSSPPPTAFQLD
jgi:hypothetical protein